jgi:nucleoside-diphosphate-sugar epimerase
MKALVTGAGGAIGTVLCQRLIERGDRVRGLFLPDENAGPLEQAGVEVVRGDITVPRTLEGLSAGIEIVFHLAGRVADWGPMQLFYEIMARGTENMLKECVDRVDRFVYVSSIAAYGMGRHLKGYMEDGPRIKCGVPYCDTKIDAEGFVRGYTFGTSTSYTIIRPANVLGPASVWIRDVCDAFFRGPVPLCDGGRHNSSFVYVHNLVDGILLAADGDAARDRAYHFRDDYTVSWKEYLTEVGEIVGKRPSFSLPSPVALRLARLVESAYLPFFPARPPMTRMAVCVMGYDNDVDTSRAREELGWKTRVGYREAMEVVTNWTRDYLAACNR